MNRSQKSLWILRISF